MKKILSTIAFLIFFASGWAQPTDSYLMSLLDAAKTPGLSVVIVKDGHWIYERNLGVADIPHNKSVTRKTMYGASTVSFAFVATAAMQLKEQGLLSLDNSINHYLPFVFVDPQRPSDSVTMRMLLTESGSIKDYAVPIYSSGDSPMSLDSFIRNYFLPGGIYYSASGNFLIDAPGTNWEHSEVSFALAAYVVERITGDKFSHYCDTAIFSKLCMKNTSYLLSEVADTTVIARPYRWQSGGYSDRGLWGIPDYPSQQLRTNISSLARFTTMFMQYGIFEGTRLLDSSSVAEIMHSYLAPSYYGLGLGFYLTTANINTDPWWIQGGELNGTGGTIILSYTRKISIALLANGTGGNLSQLVDTLYSYALTYTPTASDVFPDCNDVTIASNIADVDIQLSVFPNPSSGETTIVTPEAGVAVLSDIEGRQRGTFSLTRGNNVIKIPAGLPAGIYLVAAHNGEGVLLGVRQLLYLPR